MAKAVKAKQLIFSLPNKIGLLSEVATAIAAANVNIEAVCAYERGYGYFMMVTDNNAKAKRILSKMGAEVHVEDVLSLEVPNKVGQLEKVAKIVRSGELERDFPGWLRHQRWTRLTTAVLCCAAAKRTRRCSTRSMRPAITPPPRCAGPRGPRGISGPRG